MHEGTVPKVNNVVPLPSLDVEEGGWYVLIGHQYGVAEGELDPGYSLPIERWASS